MSLPRGRELALKLIAEADIVVENFSSRVFEHWGFDYETLRSINPRLIMARASGFGNSGPWRDHVAYATTVEQGSGLAWVTGYADDRPEVTGGACDPIAGSHAAFAVLLGLEYRRRTGKGLLIETPQFTTGLSLSAEQVIEYSSSGTLLGRDTNRSWVYAPQGAYRAADYTPPYDSMPPDDWIAISITSDEEWLALCGVIGASELAADPELASVQGRMRRHDEIDAVIGAWARPLQADSAVAMLLAAGVPASRFIGMAGLDALPEVKARGLYEEVDQPVLGRVPVIGYPAKFEKGPYRTHRTPAPTLGQHNQEILEGILGLSPAEIDELEAENIIGVKPKMGTAW
jgi:crotonobetainyl-CoA:carnitine CoA-transferase CaiB-like acyl-CoA transferase